MRLLVSRRADFLGELVDLGHNVGKLAKGRVEFLTEAQAIYHLNDLSDVIGALAKDIDAFARRAYRAVDLIQPFRGFLHRVDSAVHLLARAVGDIEENFGSIGDSLNRSDHLIDGG